MWTVKPQYAVIIVAFPLLIVKYTTGALVNVAVNKTTTQSSTFDGTDIYQTPHLTYRASAGLAVDGAATKEYMNKTCAVTSWLHAPACTQNPWWHVDLGDQYVIHRVDIYFRNVDVPSTATVQVGTQVEQASQGTAQGSVHLKSVSLSPPVTASTVKISLSGCTILQLCEVEVYADLNECSSNPCQNGGTCRDGVNSYTCTCVLGYTGINCERNFNECSSNPCQNGGTCRDGVNSYTCTCDPAFLGNNCQETNECFPNPCQNGGTCTDGYNSYTCSCVKGFTGKNCSTNIDDCGSKSCQHGGTCVDGVDSYNCTCVQGFTGSRCETNVNECVSSPCMNGTCLDGINSYTCNCTAGFTGTRCESDIKECFSNPCAHGGTCHEMVNAFRCACPLGYNGTICEENIDDCATHPCNNGSCTDGVNTFTCACKPGYRGNTCDTACTGGHYGLDCVMGCSLHCLDSPGDTDQHCHHVTGLCLRAEGCKDRYQGSMCAEPQYHFFVISGAGPNTGAIAGGTIAAVVVIIIVIAGVVWFKRRNTKPNIEMDELSEASGKIKRQQLQENVDGVEEGQESGQESHEMSSPDKDPYYNTAGAVSPTRLSPARLPDLLAKTRDDPDFLKKEYQRLPQGLTHPVTVATNEHNKGKNRYKSICAYDHSRVVLTTLPGNPYTDYINACYVHGHKKSKAFIAAQGPTEVNVADFIRMIWEKDIKKIAMVTMPFETGKMKCVEYWDDSAPKVFGNFTVTVDSVSSKREEVVRILCIKPADGAPKSVRHFLFTAWPDKDVPDSPWSLIDYRDKVTASSGKEKSPILVHCSAGIGRTGTLIAMDVMLGQLAAEGRVDIYNTVWSLRQQRVDMVQTLSQYTFLHEAALVGLCSAGRVVPLDTFSSDPVAKSKSKIANEYEALKLCIPTFSDDDCSLANVPENRHANRDQQIIPPDKSIVWLHESVGNEINYFNAIFLPNYEQKKRYILTQTPMPSTVVNFWRAVLEYGVSAIVSLDRLKPDAQAAVGAYVPVDTTPVQQGPLTLSLVNTEKHQGYTTRTIQVKLGDKASRTVQQWVANMWPENAAVPPETNQLLNLALEVCNSTPPSGGRILVHCRDGSRRSGVYVALSTLLERSSSEAEVAVPYVVGVLSSVRPQALPSREQYTFLYAAMLKHAGSIQVYENVTRFKASQQNNDEQENVYSNDL